jgi:deoxyribodipyrimidine photolyase-related protein
MKAALILGTQLLKEHPALTDPSVELIIMIEAKDVCLKLPYHRHKLILLLSGMRHFCRETVPTDKKIEYHELTKTSSFKEALTKSIKDHHVTELVWMTSADTPTNTRIQSLCKSLSIKTTHYSNGLFITPESDLRAWFDAHPRPLMETFYRWQRQRTGILCEGSLPVGGQWNFDVDNRQPLPKKGVDIPAVTFPKPDTITGDVIKMIDTEFANNPGEGSNFWLPVTHEASAVWLADFISERFDQFGPYEDAMKDGEAFLFHSVLSPLINCGLLSVDQVIQAAISAYANEKARLSSVEGFIRI